MDEFNFCETFQQMRCPAVDDLALPDHGISLSRIEYAAERISCDAIDMTVTRISSQDIAQHCSCPSSIDANSTESGWKITSTLNDQEKQYIYYNDFFEIEKFKSKSKRQNKIYFAINF